jgi:hypothetical protein
MGNSLFTSLTVNSTFLLKGCNSWNLPKRTWNGEHARVPGESQLLYNGTRSETQIPSSRSTTTTSIAPLSVAGLMEFQVLDTDPLMDPEMERTYCILDSKLVHDMLEIEKCSREQEESERLRVKWNGTKSWV